MRDPYDILQIPPTSDAVSIKHAYRRAARTYHPDKNLSSDTSKIFAEIKNAYELLSDPKKRREHDLRRRNNLLQDPYQEALSMWTSYLWGLK